MPLKSTMRRMLAALALCACGSLAPRLALAQTCWVNGHFALDFGTVDRAGKQAASYISVRCRSDAQRRYFRMCVFIGPGAQGGIQPRRMTNYNNAYLAYDLFSDPARQNLIAGPGSTPVYQLQMEVPTAYTEREVLAYIYGYVYPGQSVSGTMPFKEVGMVGHLLYLHSTTSVPQTGNCAGGADVVFNTAGVEARFEDGCVVSASDLHFGQTGSLGQPVTATSTIRVECPAGRTWSLGLGNGSHYASGTRRMQGPGGTIAYQLYRDANRSQAWGDTGPADRYAGASGAGGAAVNVTVYGRVPAQPEVEAGRYSDTVIATLYY